MDWLRRLPRAIAILARGLVTSIAGNISLAILSVALALALWLFVTDAENPTERQTFNSAIEITFVNVPEGLAVANASANTVRIDIEAPENELDALRVTDFTAEANLGGFAPGRVTVPVSVRTSAADVRIVRTTPEQIDVTLENLRTKDVPVQVALVGSPQEGFAAGDQSVEPDTVTVSGPQSLVELVSYAEAEVGLTGRRVDVTDERVTLRTRDARGGEIGRVTVAPETASVSVDIVQQDFSLEFIVNPATTGSPAAGYNVTGISVSPPIVTVTGPLEVLQTIDPVQGITTGDVALGDATATVTQDVDLILPPELGVSGSSRVQVTVTITPARGEASFLIVPQVRNVGDGLVATPSGPVTVTLSGDIPTLQALTADSIVAFVNAEGLASGLYTLPVEVTPPPGTTIVRVEPGEAGVALASPP
jgi:YbbR domain-containing protein